MPLHPTSPQRGTSDWAGPWLGDGLAHAARGVGTGPSSRDGGLDGFLEAGSLDLTVTRGDVCCSVPCCFFSLDTERPDRLVWDYSAGGVG
jgi:hypothetical protein